MLNTLDSQNTMYSTCIRNSLEYNVFLSFGILMYSTCIQNYLEYNVIWSRKTSIQRIRCRIQIEYNVTWLIFIRGRLLIAARQEEYEHSLWRRHVLALVPQRVARPVALEKLRAFPAWAQGAMHVHRAPYSMCWIGVFDVLYRERARRLRLLAHRGGLDFG